MIYRMVHGESNISPNLLNRLLAAGGAPVLLLLIFISQYVLKLDFTCPCSSSASWKLAVIVVYLVLPCLTLMFVVFLKDHHFKKTIMYCCNSRDCSPALDFYKCVFKGVALAAMWIITTLLDGDWFVCVMTFSGNYTGISCKEKETRSTEESEIFDNFKSQSQMWGFVCLSTVCLIWIVASSLPSNCHPFYKLKYKKYLAKQTHLLLKKELGDQAKEQAQTRCTDSCKKALERLLKESEIESAISEAESSAKQSKKSAKQAAKSAKQAAKSAKRAAKSAKEAEKAVAAVDDTVAAARAAVTEAERAAAAVQRLAAAEGSKGQAAISAAGRTAFESARRALVAADAAAEAAQRAADSRAGQEVTAAVGPGKRAAEAAMTAANAAKAAAKTARTKMKRHDPWILISDPEFHLTSP